MNSNGSANSGALSFIRLILHARRNVEYLASDHGKPHGGEYQLFFSLVRMTPSPTGEVSFLGLHSQHD